MATTTPPPFDPELAAALGDAIPPTITPDMVPAMRAVLLDGLPSLEQLSRQGTFTIEERVVPGPEGAPDVHLLVARPAGSAGHRPVVFHTHGGGMVMGDRRYGLDSVLDAAADLDLVVVSVEYRLAPEHPFPAGVEDAYAGLRWTAEHADEVGGDPDRLVLFGSSSGAGLTAALALIARDRHGPRAVGQVLLYPMLDDRNDSASARQMDGLGVWDRTSNQTGWAALLGDLRGSADLSAYAAPARAEDLSGLPPTFLDVGSAETFRDEVVAYASRIWASGGQAELHVWPGAFHGFDVWAPGAAISKDAVAVRLRWLRRLLDE